jgi:hypothetical protein
VTDGPEQEPLDPEEERVRALLADLGRAPDAATMPSEVAARLEDTLASLQEERSAATVVPLRRRWSPRLAVAAAAVIVVGAGGIAAANLGVFGGSTVSDSSSAGNSAGGTSKSLDGPATAQPSAPSTRKPLPGQLANGLASGLPRVSAASFDTDVARVLRGSSTAAGDTSAAERKAADATCPGPRSTGGSTTTLVLYDGTRAILVAHPEQAGEQLVVAWTCTGDRELDRTVVPSDPGLGGASPTP